MYKINRHLNSTFLFTYINKYKDMNLHCTSSLIIIVKLIKDQNTRILQNNENPNKIPSIVVKEV